MSSEFTGTAPLACWYDGVHPLLGATLNSEGWSFRMIRWSFAAARAALVPVTLMCAAAIPLAAQQAPEPAAASVSAPAVQAEPASPSSPTAAPAENAGPRIRTSLKSVEPRLSSNSTVLPQDNVDMRTNYLVYVLVVAVLVVLLVFLIKRA